MVFTQSKRSNSIDNAVSRDDSINFACRPFLAHSLSAIFSICSLLYRNLSYLIVTASLLLDVITCVVHPTRVIAAKTKMANFNIAASRKYRSVNRDSKPLPATYDAADDVDFVGGAFVGRVIFIVRYDPDAGRFADRDKFDTLCDNRQCIP